MNNQHGWRCRLRLGGLIGAIQPIQPADMMGVSLPKIEGAASCAMVARQMASAAGFSHVILYATNDGQRIYKSDGNWFCGHVRRASSPISTRMTARQARLTCWTWRAGCRWRR
jgi:hypothetical protein